MVCFQVERAIIYLEMALLTNQWGINVTAHIKAIRAVATHKGPAQVGRIAWIKVKRYRDEKIKVSHAQNRSQSYMTTGTVATWGMNRCTG